MCDSWRFTRQLGPAFQLGASLGQQLPVGRFADRGTAERFGVARGLLKDTLVVWSGEFGRTPHAQGDDGRDHNNAAFTGWMAVEALRVVTLMAAATTMVTKRLTADVDP